MNKTNMDELKKAVEAKHGSIATFAQAIPIRESREGKTTWCGMVHIFNLADHP